MSYLWASSSSYWLRPDSVDRLTIQVARTSSSRRFGLSSRHSTVRAKVLRSEGTPRQVLRVIISHLVAVDAARRVVVGTSNWRVVGLALLCVDSRWGGQRSIIIIWMSKDKHDLNIKNLLMHSCLSFPARSI